MTCPACGHENAPDARFCSACGSPLAEPQPERRERKILTVLFADLVGSTAHAEQLDPEEVDARLRSYHAHVRAELERFGATVEKFIGDAVVALFGAPVAHEDDPERAVRAALAIRDWARDAEDLQVRVAVNTGEALVTLDARPSGGEGMAAGDVLNTAARLQSAAPVNGILVGPQTYRATERVIEYNDHDPVEAKGKADPVPVWEALAVRSRLGVDVSQESRAPLVGRERERDLLVGTLRRAVAEDESQLVTLVGVPGIGKSRLVYELLEVVEADEDLIYWRQGRCLPYGDGVAFWAFGEMVKAQAGILETDSSDEAQHKLAEMAGDLCDEDAAWVERALRPLVGLGGDGSHDSREEAFAAWRRVVEAMADRRPTVLVFEDLHWADEGLLDFIDHLVDWSTGVPLLCVCTARPELLERRPGWGGGKLNSTTIALPALSEDDTQRLLAGLLGRTVLPAELLQFAGGNPLYAEEYARMLSDRGLDEAALPETVQGIIAARLDALSAEEKTAIQNGAVFGKVFWSGSLAALDGGDAAGLQAPLHSLVRKEFVRRERRSSVGGQDEYAFRHVLVRDVAYGQIPRAERAEKHRRAAEWIESLSERSEDLADLLAHHYVSALEYGADGLGERAAHALREAGDRSRDLNSFAPAIRYYRAAVELLPEGDPGVRGEILYALGQARWLAESEGAEELQESVAILGARNPELAADALSALAILSKQDQRRTLELYERALELVRDRPPTKEKASVLALYGGQLHLAHEPARAFELTREAVEIAEEVGDVDQLAQALLATGNVGDMERALKLAVESDYLTTAARCYGNLADAYASHRADLGRCFALQTEGRRTAERIGGGPMLDWLTGERAAELYLRGRWDEAVDVGEPLTREMASSRHPHFIEVPTRVVLASIAIARDDAERADHESAVALDKSRGVGDLQVLYTAVACRAVVVLETGDEDAAGRLFSEFMEHLAGEVERTGQAYTPWLERLTLAWLSLRFGYADDLADLLARDARPVGSPWAEMASPWAEMVSPMLQGDLLTAAARAEEHRLLPDAAWLRLQAARVGDTSGLDKALAFYEEGGATRYVREAGELAAA
jgi:class 3 adenylate cyclase/tetratricopeptide (TPR) repeat protein